MAFGFCGEKVRLVPYDSERHFENFYQWINDPEMTYTLAMIGTPVTRLDQDKFFEGMASSQRSVYFVIETIEGQHIGASSIDEISWPNGTAMTGSFIGPKEYRGKGYGTESAILRARYAFTVLGLRILKSCHYSHNPASARMQAKAGYVEYGRIENEIWKEGEFRDTTYTHLTRERFYEIHGS